MCPLPNQLMRLLVHLGFKLKYYESILAPTIVHHPEQVHFLDIPTSQFEQYLPIKILKACYMDKVYEKFYDILKKFLV